MGYVARMTDAEKMRLNKLLGASLTAVINRGWDVLIHTAGDSIAVVPEEVSTPYCGNPDENVVRPSLAPDPPVYQPNKDGLVARDLGPVTEVSVLTTELAYSQPTLPGPIEPGGAATSPIALDAVFRRPSITDGTVTATSNGVILDVAVVLRTPDHKVIIYSDGFTYFIDVACDQLPDTAWANNALFAEEALGQHGG